MLLLAKPHFEGSTRMRPLYSNHHQAAKISNVSTLSFNGLLQRPYLFNIKLIKQFARFLEMSLVFCKYGNDTST